MTAALGWALRLLGKVPLWVWAALALLAWGAAGRIEAAHQKERAAKASQAAVEHAAAAQGERQAREQEHAAAVAVSGAINAKDRELARSRAAAASARGELDRLRGTLAEIAAASPPAPAASAPGGSDDAVRARTVVGLCAESLQTMAETADACEARVIGLQGYVRAILGSEH